MKEVEADCVLDLPFLMNMHRFIKPLGDLVSFCFGLGHTINIIIYQELLHYLNKFNQSTNNKVKLKMEKEGP